MRIVVRARPVARSTSAIPPPPIASASAAAHSRLIRSSITGLSASYFARISASLAIPTVDHTSHVQSILLRALFVSGALVVGWSVSAVNDRHLTIKALDMALRRRCPGAGLLHHSDQGCTYASEDYQRELKKHGITCSMSRRGNCYDNAAMESWNSTLKSELGERFESYGSAKEQL